MRSKCKSEKPMTYVELHARSAFSFLEGTSTPEALAGACAEIELPAAALLDRDGVYGAPRFHLRAQKLGVKAHIGSEVTIGSSDDRMIGRSEKQNPLVRWSDEPIDRFFRLPLLAADRTGYQNLCRL